MARPVYIVDGSRTPFIKARGKPGPFTPATGGPVGSVIAAGERDVHCAVAAARAAFDDPGGWSNWEPADRAAVLNEFARQYQLVAEDMVRTVCQQNGMPIVRPRNWKAPCRACY